MSEIMVGEWTVTSSCTICGSPYLSKPSYKFDAQGDQDKPVTINTCSCFKNQEKISRPENSVSRVVKLRSVNDKEEDEFIYTVTSTNPNDVIKIDDNGNFTITRNPKAVFDPHNMGEM
jgi:hypothetical protein